MLIHSEHVTDIASLVGEHPLFIDGADINGFGEPVRHSGWHLSGILRGIAIEIGEVNYEPNGDGWESRGDEESEIEEFPHTQKEAQEILERARKQNKLAGALLATADSNKTLYDSGDLANTNIVKPSNPISFEWNLSMLMGFAWEEYIVKRVPGGGTIWRPNQYDIPVPGTNHKVWCSPDGLTDRVVWLEGVEIDAITKAPPKSPNRGRIIPVVGEEFKCTKKSRRKPIQKQWMWMNQIRGYAQPDCLDTLFFRLHVCYVNGAYEKGRLGEWEYWRYWIELTPYELQSMWQMVTNYVIASGR